MATGALLGAVASAGANALASKFFGGKNKASPAIDRLGSAGANFGGFSAGGLTATPGGSGFFITPSAERTQQVGQIAATFPEQAKEIGELRGLVAPGISALRKAALAQIDNSRQATVGNLRENLQRRRVLGSSFASDAIARTEAEFGFQKSRVEAETTMQEIETSMGLIESEFAARRGEFETRLNEMNFQAEIASKLATQFTAELGASSRFQARLLAEEATAAGKAFGSTFQPVFNRIGEMVASYANGA